MSHWAEQCPMRQPGLSHVHWNQCFASGVHPGTDERHAVDQCCHCGEHIGIAIPGSSILGAMPPIDMEARLRSLGLIPPPPPEPGEVREVDVVNLHEPHLATGGMPQGPKWGRGRSWDGKGGLTPRDHDRLKFLRWRLGDHHES